MSTKPDIDSFPALKQYITASSVAADRIHGENRNSLKKMDKFVC